jgi:hypothetical protein
MLSLFYDRKVCGSEARLDQRALASEDRENVFFSKSMEKNRSKKNKQRSGAQKRKTKKEKEEAIIKEAVEKLERLKLGPTALWTGLVLHHKDIFVSHVLSKLNGTDQSFFGLVNTQSWGEKTINTAAEMCNLEMLKYCFSNDCPCDERASFLQAAVNGHLDCLRFLFAKVEPSRETEEEAAYQAVYRGHMDILKYFVEERKISEEVKSECVGNAARYGGLDCIKYLVEEAKVPLNYWRYIASARYYEHSDCLNYLLEKGCPEPTDEQYAELVEIESNQQNRGD